MVKRWMTILFLLAFSALPIAAQVYQAAEFVCEVITQADADEGTMECCRIAGQCKMREMQQEAAVKECVMQCACDWPEPLLPASLLTSAPQVPHVDDTILPPSPLTGWTEAHRTNSTIHFWLPPKNSLINFRHTCLRI